MKIAKAFARYLAVSSTIFGFGALMLSSHPEIQTFGLASFLVGGFACACVFIRTPIQPPTIPRG